MRLPRIRRRWVLPGVLAALLVLVIGAGAGAAFEADTVSNYWQGLWWALSLMTTVGFINGPPHTVLGAVTSGVLMIAGFLLLSLISASLAALFVREDEEPAERGERDRDTEILALLHRIEQRLEDLERGSRR